MEKEEKSAQGDKSRESLNAPAALLTVNIKQKEQFKRIITRKYVKYFVGINIKKLGLKEHLVNLKFLKILFKHIILLAYRVKQIH